MAPKAAAVVEAAPEGVMLKKKVTPIVEYLSQTIMMGGGDWETLEYFAEMMPSPLPVRFRLAKLASMVRRAEPPWNTIVEELESFDDNFDVPPNLCCRADIMVDVATLCRIPREEKDTLDELLSSMQENYEGNEQVFEKLHELVEAYKTGSEEDLLQSGLFSGTQATKAFNQWFKQLAVNELGKLKAPPVIKILKRRTGANDGDLADLRSKRARLNAQVDDPLQEARFLSKQAVKSKSKGHAFYEKKAGEQIKWDKDDFGSDDDDDDDIDEPAGATHHLSGLPEQVQFQSPTRKNKSRRSPMKSPPSAKRIWWTQEQRLALMAAIKEYGVHSWAAIRDSEKYQQFWANRPAATLDVKLKDLYRTMKKQGVEFEIDETAKEEHIRLCNEKKKPGRKSGEFRNKHQDEEEEEEEASGEEIEENDDTETEEEEKEE